MMDLALTKLTQLAFGYWQSQTLFALTQIGIFEAVADQPRTGFDLAQELQLDEMAASALLRAGVTLGLLREQEGEYGNSELATRFLTSSSQEDLTEWVRTMSQWVSPWMRLEQVVRGEAPKGLEQARLSKNSSDERRFILAMHQFARRTSDRVSEALDLSDARVLADIGGGAGTYSISLCRRYPFLKSQILDRPSVLPIAEEVIAEAGLKDSISTSACDYRFDSFGDQVDVVLMSNVLHQESRQVGRSMVQRARDALRAGGAMVIHGHFLDNDHVRPTFSVLQDLSATILWQGGGNYTVGEVEKLLEAEGFDDVRSERIPESATTLCRGRRA
jgi:hypothetical protein